METITITVSTDVAGLVNGAELLFRLLPKHEARSIVSTYDWESTRDRSRELGKMKRGKAVDGNVIITESELESLRDSEARLLALQSGGVDNWEGYSDSLREYFAAQRDDDEKPAPFAPKPEQPITLAPGADIPPPPLPEKQHFGEAKVYTSAGTVSGSLVHTHRSPRTPPPSPPTSIDLGVCVNDEVPPPPPKEVETDDDGVAFDPELHTGTKTSLGKWRKKRTKKTAEGPTVDDFNAITAKLAPSGVSGEDMQTAVSQAVFGDNDQKTGGFAHVLTGKATAVQLERAITSLRAIAVERGIEL